MKSILLIRHAKSSWEYPQLTDEERPLNDRGNRDAPMMAAHIRNEGLIPSHLITSPARRAYDTASYFYSEFEKDGAELWKESDLYFGSETDWLHLINILEDDIKFPFFFSHNPTITYFANRFTNNWIDNIPTCGVVYIESSADNWKDFYFDNSIIRELYFPKKVKKLYD